MTQASEPTDDILLDRLQHAAFEYFLQTANPANGLIADNSRVNSPVSIAVVGFALASFPVAVERGWLARADAVARSLAALRFFRDSDQSGGPEATGYKGFYYHFLDPDTGARVWRSELSMIDTALLIAGALTGSMYFDANTPDEIELRKLVDMLFGRIDWKWAQAGRTTLSQGWKPECGFLHYGWEGYNEAIRALRTGAGFADATDRRLLLPRVDSDLPMGKSVRSRFSLWRPAIHPPVLARMDRFSRHPGPLHA